MSGLKRFASGAVGTFLWGLVLAAAFFGPAPAPAFQMVIDDESLTIDAERVPLSEILQRLAESGVRIHIAPDIGHEVTARFDRRPLAAGLAAILRPLNHSLIWETIQTPLGPVQRLVEISVFRAEDPRPGPVVSASRPVLKIRTDSKTGACYLDRQVMIAFDRTMDMAGFKALLLRIGGRLIDVDPVLGVYRIAVSEDEDIPGLCRRLVLEPGVAAAEPNYAYRMQPAIPRPLIDGPVAALPFQRPSFLNDIAPVAVLDSGWRADPAYSNAVAAAYDALAPNAPIDDAVGHGTQMALIASGLIHPLGTEENRPDSLVPVVAVRIFDDNGYTDGSVLMRGIDFALKSGARVISLSWGSETPSAFMEQAVNTVRDRGAVVVASAGNENTGKPVYPAAYEAVVGVGALNPEGAVWPRSNQGDFVDLLAPGFASLPVGSQGEAPGAYAGTSIAAAYTACRLALELSRNPDALAAEVLESQLKSR